MNILNRAMAAQKLSAKPQSDGGTAETLKLNDERIVSVRQEWISAGWHPPKD